MWEWGTMARIEPAMVGVYKSQDFYLAWEFPLSKLLGFWVVGKIGILFVLDLKKPYSIS